MSVYNNSNRILSYNFQGVQGVVLPHSEKVLSLSDIDGKIKKVRNHISHLKTQIAHHGVRGGKKVRARNISIQTQISSASNRLELLETARSQFKFSVPCSLSCGHLMDFQFIGRRINQNNSICPLDGYRITSVLPVNEGLDAFVAFEFPAIDIKFYANINTPVSVVADVYDVCRRSSLVGRLTPVLSLIPNISNPPNEASNFKGTIERTSIESIDIVEKEPSNQRFHGNFKANNSITLSNIGIIAGLSLKIIPHTNLRWNPE